MASGASGVTPDTAELTEAVRSVSADLARQLVADAEGASHDVHVIVRSATTEAAALVVAREIARSNLVKAAIFGNDPNWGRIVAAAGCVPEHLVPFDVADLSVTVNGVEVCRDGGAHRDRSEVDMSPREILIEDDLGAGSADGDIWTNDLTHDYVDENSADPPRHTPTPSAPPSTPAPTPPTPRRTRWSARTPWPSSTPPAPRPARSPRS